MLAANWPLIMIGARQRESFRQIGSNFLIPQVSIITVYYNNPEDLTKLSTSMKSCLSKDQYEWIVVDNNSNLNLSAQLDCSYLLQSENIGFGAGCNAGAKA